ncbi:MAG: hypothetical protein ACERKD_07925 [Prolixibacteraceae bacterium]
MRLVLVTTLFLLISGSGNAKNRPLTDTIDSKIKIFLDCDDCNSSFFKRNLAYVDYVRDDD